MKIVQLIKTLTNKIKENQSSDSEMALDLVEIGNDELFLVFEKGKNASENLPLEINSKMLYRDIIRLAWPAFVELILTQLTSMADLIMVGQLGPWAIASVGLSTQPKLLLTTMFMAMNVGATALVARYKGADDYYKANMVLKQALFLTFILSIISSIIGYIYSEPLIRFMGASDPETLAGGTSYLKIQMIGFVFMGLTTTITATLRGVGNSWSAMIYNATANAVNIFLNYILIYGHFGFPRMEVAGASLATIISQAVAFIMAASIILKGNQYLYLNLKEKFKPNIEYIKSIFNIGFPAMLEQLLMRVGVIIYSKTVASLGTLAFATHQVCLNIQSLSLMNGQAFAVPATSLMGQSLGKKRPDMAHSYCTRTRRLGLMVSIIIGVLFILFGERIVALYTNDPAVIKEGARILKLIALIQPFQCSQLILSGALRGAGDTMSVAIVVFITVLLVRPGIAMLNIYVLHLGLEGAWYAFMIDQLIRSFLIVLRFNSGKWKTVRIA